MYLDVVVAIVKVIVQEKKGKKKKDKKGKDIISIYTSIIGLNELK